MSRHTIRRRAKCADPLHSRDGVFTAQYKLNLWLQKRLISAVTRFSPVDVIAPLLQSHHQLHTSSSRRTEGRIWQPSKSTALSEIGKHGIEKYFHLFFQYSTSMPCVRRLVNGLSPRTARQPGQFNDLRRTKWRWDKFSPSASVFSLPTSFHQCSILIFIYTLLLPERQTGKTWDLSRKQSSFGSRGALDKVLPVFSRFITSPISFKAPDCRSIHWLLFLH